jgi:hypothetical protein
VREGGRFRPAPGTCLPPQPREDPAQVVEQEMREIVGEPLRTTMRSAAMSSRFFGKV